LFLGWFVFVGGSISRQTKIEEAEEIMYFTASPERTRACDNAPLMKSVCEFLGDCSDDVAVAGNVIGELCFLSPREDLLARGEGNVAEGHVHAPPRIFLLNGHFDEWFLQGLWETICPLDASKPSVIIARRDELLPFLRGKSKQVDVEELEASVRVPLL
jgi:hypothetical protein